MKTLFALVLSVLLCGVALADVANDGGGLSSLYYCWTTPNIAEFDTALDDWGQSQDLATAFFVLVFRSTATITDGPATTGHCGSLAAGESEWRVQVQNSLASAWLDFWADKMGYVDVNPADGLDDQTGLTRAQFADASIKAELRRHLLNYRARQRDETAIVDPGLPD